jgi:serine/threonine protein phosphatase PrpC
MIIRFAFKTDTGRARDHNEDNFFVLPDLTDSRWEYTSEPFTVGPMGSVFAIADGMGGASAGEVASMEAISAVEKSIKELGMSLSDNDEAFHGQIKEIFQKAQSRIIQVCRADPSVSGMGTTLLLGWIRNGRLHMAWLGDSRGYLSRKDGNLYHITRDHSYVQELLDAGKIDKKQAFYHPDSNVITKSLGDFNGRYQEPEIAVYELEEGDRILLCSDGLNSMLMDAEIAEILFNEKDVRVCADKCIEAANEKGGHDNITVIVMDIEGVDKRQASPLKHEHVMRIAHDATSGFHHNGGNPGDMIKGGPGNGGMETMLRKYWLMLTLISLTLLSVGFLAGRLVMRREIELLNQPHMGKGKADGQVENRAVQSKKDPTIHKSDQIRVPKENLESNPEKMIEVEPQRDTQGKKLKRLDNWDTLRRKAKDTGKKVLTPIESN